MNLNQEAPPAKAPSMEDGGHWYESVNGLWQPLYEPGGTFTLREARKLKKEGRKVVPSVTSYFKVLHKEMLVEWKIEQALRVSAESPYDVLLEPPEAWIDRIKAKASGASMGAADLGTAIHDAIESAIMGNDYEAKYEVYVVAVLKLRREMGLKSIGPEACVGSLKHGYAGRVDDRCEGSIIVDYKSRKTKPNRKVATYETDAIQLSAYGYAEWGENFFYKGKGFIFVISTTEPGRVEAVEFTGAELSCAFEAFLGLTSLWRYTKKFDPRVIDV